MILKPGKAPEETSSYRPISLLPVFSKVMEILFLKRLNTVIAENKIIPEHHFGFRKNNDTIEQVHRLVEEIHKAFESRKYYGAAFLAISQAFDRFIWTYGIQLWVTAANSNQEILQRFQSKMLRIITDAPWFVTNQQLHHDLEIRTVQEEIKHSMKSYRNRLENHPNILTLHLMNNITMFKRLKRKSPRDL
ncbi:unnamed protein product [Euphydryas editha]|uniref:Reverse transcriptase domain-containing protein n=2 Tax=Euphydryas editha TaxID=104508 RepID=A0AAU9V9P3_EUPED|nr:unnamed protein product [Euphydryas editha]